MNREYEKAFENAPEAFKRSMEKMGMEAKAKTDNQTSNSIEYNEGYLTASYTTDMAEVIDTHVDRLIEEHGVKHEMMIRKIAAALEDPMKLEIERNRALMLGRVACYLVKSEAQNVLARVHSLLHAIPRLAAVNGFKSMRESARACRVSPQWIKLGRDKWCAVLGIPIPAEGSKQEAAKEKYRKSAMANHWRKQKVTKVTACVAGAAGVNNDPATNHTTPKCKLLLKPSKTKT